MVLVRYLSRAMLKSNYAGGVLAGTYVMASRAGFISITMEETDLDLQLVAPW